MTPDDIARLRALAAAATPGPWKADYSNDDYSEEYVFTTGALPADGVRCVVGSEWHNGFNLLLREHDAAFIAATRNAVPALCDEVEALRSIARDVAEAYPDPGNGAHDACRKAPCIGCRARRALAGGQ